MQVSYEVGSSRSEQEISTRKRITFVTCNAFFQTTKNASFVLNSLSRTDLLLRAGTSDFIRNLHKAFSLKDLNFHSEFAFASIHLSNFIVKSYQRQLSLILGRLFRDVLAPLLLTILNKHSAGQLQSCYSCAFEFHNSIIR